MTLSASLRHRRHVSDHRSNARSLGPPVEVAAERIGAGAETGAVPDDTIAHIEARARRGEPRDAGPGG